MAVTVESTSLGTAVVTTPQTISHTTGATATGLFVGVGIEGNTCTVTGITFNGVALTKLWGVTDGLLVVRTEGWLLVNPSIGTYNIVVTYSAGPPAANAGGVGLAGLEATSVANAHRTIYTATGGGGGAPGGPTVTVTDSQNGDLVIDSAVTYNGTITAGTGQTSRAEDDALAGGPASWGISTESATGASTVMSWATGDYWVTNATALIAASGGAAFLAGDPQAILQAVNRSNTY